MAKKEEVIFQFYGKDYDTEDIVKKAKEAFTAEGDKKTAIKDMSVYIKPEEGKAYYVVNNDKTGSLDI